jgi:hypothetical protein
MTAAKKGPSEGNLAKTPQPNGINGENGEVVPMLRVEKEKFRSIWNYPNERYTRHKTKFNNLLWFRVCVRVRVRKCGVSKR